jgi:hypothetical protein
LYANDLLADELQRYNNFFLEIDNYPNYSKPHFVGATSKMGIALLDSHFLPEIFFFNYSSECNISSGNRC